MRVTSWLVLLAEPTAALVCTPGQHSYSGFDCAFRRKAAAPGQEERPPLLLVHPVGIGLDSWFWDRFLEAWDGEVFIPDLIGCGASERWEPSEKGLFVPLDWVRQLESLWREHIQRPAVVVCQGGLAPVGVQLASRETETWRGGMAVLSLVLASPPEWEKMSTGLDEAGVRNNFGLLSATLGGRSLVSRLGYRLLCSRVFVQFFSDQFLFADDADPAFIEACSADKKPELRRWPVLAFNAGLVGMRGLEGELRGLRQPLLVLAGEADGKPLTDGGQGYAEGVPDCRVVRLPGKNVLPWESTVQTADAIDQFCS